MIYENDIDVTPEEEKAIKRVVAAFKGFPRTLMVFAGGTGLEIRKPDEDGDYFADRVLIEIYGVKNDGGDGGDPKPDGRA